MEWKVEGIDNHNKMMKGRLDGMDSRLEHLDSRMEYLEGSIETMT